MTAKAKRLARNYPVPQTRDDCDRMIRELGDMRRSLARVEADMNDNLAKVKERFETKAEPLRDKANELVEGIETWCAANRDLITNGNKVKFARMKNGEVKWRSRPPKVTIRGAEAVIEALRALGLSRFIRTKEEINRDAVLDEPDAVKTVKGISIGSEGEDFVIEPFEQEITPEIAKAGG